MTASWLCALALGAPPAAFEIPVVEVIRPDSGIVTLQALVRAPGLSGPETAALRVLGPWLLAGSREFTPRQIRDFGSQAGWAPRAEVFPDWMRLEFVAPPGGLGVLATLLESILRRPSLDERDFPRVRREAMARHDDPWGQALWGLESPVETVDARRVRALAQRVLRADRVILVVGGAVTPEEVDREVRRRFSDWLPPRGEPEPHAEQALPRARPKAPVTVLELAGEPFHPAGEAEAARVMALFALGVGKDTPLFRSIREEDGAAYQVAAILWPSVSGWRPRLLVAQIAREDPDSELERIRRRLREDVARWGEETRVRALALAEASLKRGLVVSPFWLSPDGPFGPDVVSRARWMGYMALVDSSASSPEELLARLARVRLEEMRDEASEFLDRAAPIVMRAGP